MSEVSHPELEREPREATLTPSGTRMTLIAVLGLAFGLVLLLAPSGENEDRESDGSEDLKLSRALMERSNTFWAIEERQETGLWHLAQDRCFGVLSDEPGCFFVRTWSRYTNGDMNAVADELQSVDAFSSGQLLRAAE